MNKLLYTTIILFFTIFFDTRTHTNNSIQKKLFLMPAGDAHNIGRHIGDGVERSCTLQCAQKMKLYIEKIDSRITVLLSRKAGEITPFLQNAHSANCIPVNLAVSIHFFEETDTRSNWYIYQYKNNSSFIKPTDQLLFYPYNQAYLFNQEKTDRIVKIFSHYLINWSEKPLFTLHKPLAFPANHLAGIIPVAFMLEIGIKNEHDYESYIAPLCDSLIKTIRDL